LFALASRARGIHRRRAPGFAGGGVMFKDILTGRIRF